MAFNTDYTSFSASLQTWMDVSGLSSTLMSDLITVGEDRIFREVRTSDMEVSLSTVMSAGMIAVPSSYLAMKYLYLNTTPQIALERRSAEWIYANYPQSSASGKPKYFGRAATNFIFGPFPDSSYTVNGVYYKRLTSISGSGLNALFTTNPDLYLFACLAESEIVIGRDERIPVWESKYQKILMSVNGMDKAEDQSGSSLQMRPYDSLNQYINR